MDEWVLVCRKMEVTGARSKGRNREDLERVCG